ncbi:MAG: xanthine dehydrogenase family protein molybdopterin-binding subunit [Alphaproteobacteria bacterium]|nr:xanthine dehydrogenase family protein molybdopterin-binding subunit [Alphaproteobacteria bacterium]
MDQPDHRRRLDEMVQGVIGQPIDRVEGPLKVTGRATYAHEFPVDGLAYGVFARATIAKGRITGCNRDQIAALPGVLAIYDDARLLRNPAQGTLNKAPVQDPHEVAYVGQPVALVVAETFEAARHAAQIMNFEYETAEAVIDPENAESEIRDGSQLDQGDIDAAMREAAFTVDATYTTPPHNSAPMEPHCSIAAWDGDDLTVHGSYQMLKYNRNELADALGIDAGNVRILSPFVGGGFGSKLGIAPEAVGAAIAAKDLGRPVSVTLTRQQVFEAVMRRSESRQRVRLAADNDGRLTGLSHACRVSNLPGEIFSEPVSQATHFTYRGDHREIVHDIRRVNRTCAGSVRAPGEAIGVTIFENAMDELAVATGIDPVELRKRNIPDVHPESGAPYSSRKFAEALDEGARRFGWDQRPQQPASRKEGEWLIGMGMAAAVRINHIQESVARVTLQSDATAVVETDMTDIGTGTYTILTQIASEMLGLSVERIATSLGDTAHPAAAGSGGSWGASSSGSSVFVACEEIRRQLCQRLGCDEADLVLKDGDAMTGNRKVPLTAVLNGDSISVVGKIEPGKATDERHQGTYGTHFAEVAVSSVTGETRVRRMLGVFSAGRILNEKTARSQCYGGMVWGIGMALTEEVMHDPRDGHVVNRDFAEYHIPVNLDAPQLEVVLLDERDDWTNPLQSKGIGELSICGSAAAITNAIYNATGVRIRDYPATLDKVLAGLN